MKIILAPAKNMISDSDSLSSISVPTYIDEAGILLNYLKSLNQKELKDLYRASDDIVLENIERLKRTDLSSNLTPAIIAYDGIAFKHMSPGIFTNDEFDYVQKHLRILSGLYGVLKPLDGVRPYRLEMASKIKLKGYKDLYDFWKDKIYKEVCDREEIIINLASKEYSKCIEDYLKPNVRFVNVNFVEDHKGRLVTKATFAKMARGEMVRYMAENQIEDVETIKSFHYLNYRYRDDLSSENNLFFERIKK